MSKDEKRALLANWASDVHAVPDAPSLRRLEDGTVLHIDNILEALKALDAGAETIRRPAARLPVRRPEGKPYFRLVDDDDDPPPKPAAAPIPKGWTFELMTYEARAA